MQVSFRHYRIFILLLILLIVVWDQWLDRAEIRSWERPLTVVVYPINGDGSKNADRYIRGLRESQFQRIEKLVAKEARRYGVELMRPIEFYLGSKVDSLPPQPPQGGNVLDIMWWNFKVRRWAGSVDDLPGPKGDIKAFVQYYDHHGNGALGHSVGVEKGRLAIVKLYATRAQAAENDMVLLHEVLHTVGASDKYDLATNRPLFPEGYANPQQKPLYPQKRAEIMAGRIATAEYQFQAIRSLNQVVIGPKTAGEIGWATVE
jgi:hypothetical protein